MDEIQRNTNFKEQAENNTGSEVDEKKQKNQEEILSGKQMYRVLRSAQEIVTNTMSKLRPGR